MNKTHRLVGLLLAVILVLAACGGAQTSAPTPAPTADAPAAGDAPAPDAGDEPAFEIGAINMVEHPALEAAFAGFLQALEDEGINFTVDYQNAQGDAATLTTIAQRFVNNNVDLILAITTPGAQAMASETEDIPIVGTAITDYVVARLVESNEAPGTNITGASDMNPIQAQIELMLEFLPDMQTIGIMWSSNEPNSVHQAEIAQQVAQSLGLNVEVATVTTTVDVPQVALSLAGRSDAIYVPTDNTIANAMAAMAGVSLESGTPVFAGEENMTRGGGVATLSVNYFDLGHQSGVMAAQILRGEGVPATMPIQFAQGYNYVVNAEMVEALGLEVPSRLLSYLWHPDETAE
ncbi:MAG: ABC transporter substrate-binding protein [Oscillospiraceae bacterium]|nr:ABC transporter substrate-binding protein [Oscillospiraceae bacterium]